MIFNRIVGHSKNIVALKKSLDGRAAHAFLFCGPSSVGKKLVALGFAQGLLCTSDTSNPCGKCKGCLRVESRNHPDLFVFEPSETTLKIEQIREIQKFVSFKSYEGGHRVVILDEAQSLTPQAANSLLKTLEEPPANSYFILISRSRGAILPTILSRCQTVQFGTLTSAELKRVLPDAEDWIVELSGGSIEAANKYSDNSFKKIRAQAVKVFKALPEARVFEGFSGVSELNDERETALFAVTCWSAIVRAAAAKSLHAKINIPPDEAPVVDALSQILGTKGCLDLSKKIQRLESDIQANINKSLAFEKFWLEAKELYRV